MTNSTKPSSKSAHLRAPLTLSPEARAWWRTLTSEYELDDDLAILLLKTAMEALDRLRAAQAILAKDGMIIEDRFGQKRAHPACIAERDARTGLLRSLKALNLDVVPPGPIGRPPNHSKPIERRRGERPDGLVRV